MRHRSQPNPECGCHTFNQDASYTTLIQGNPCIEVLTKRLISNIYIKVHWHGTTEKPKVRNGAGLFKYKSTHRIYFISIMRWSLSGTLIYHCHTGRPVPCIAHTTDNLVMARLFSGEDSTFSSLLAYFRKLENDNLLHITNVQRGHPCVKGSRKARIKDYGHICLHNCIV